MMGTFKAQCLQFMNNGRNPLKLRLTLRIKDSLLELNYYKSNFILSFALTDAKKTDRINSKARRKIELSTFSLSADPI